MANWGELAVKHPGDVMSALPPPPFYDTHAGVHRLTEAGVEESHAEAIVGEQLHFVGENVASKADIILLRQELKADIEAVRQELKAEIAAVRHDTEQVRQELKTGIEAVRQSAQASEQSLRNSIRVELKEAQFSLVRWIVALNMTTIVLVVGLFIKLL